MSSELKAMEPKPLGDEKRPIGEEDINAPVLKTPGSMAIWAACLDDLTGKDKIAKVVQYGLRMLGAIDQLNTSSASNISSSLKWKRFNALISILNSVSGVQNQLLIMIGKLAQKLSGLLTALSAYRQLLRAGTLPFRFHRLISQLKYSLNILTTGESGNYAIKVNKLTNFWISWNILSQLINLQYAIADETILAFKLNLIDKVKFKKLLDLAEDHEVWSWFVMIGLGLRNDFIKWNDLNTQESQLVLNEKVKNQTRRIVQQMKSNPVSPPSDDLLIENVNITSQIKSIWHQKKMVMVDAVRLGCDLVYDAPFVFRWSISKRLKPLHLLLGVFSGLLGFYKVWVAQRERLIKELNEN